MSDTDNADQLLHLIEIMATLRATGGCPWDREQTPESLKPYILEEAYEVIEAIDGGDWREICDELGDLLLQVIFVAQIFTEREKFNFSSVANSIATKLVRRHPHVFGDADAASHAQRWENIKQQERRERGKGNKLGDRIPKSLPALKKATKVAKKTEHQQIATIASEISRNVKKISQESGHKMQSQIETVLGEILFSTVQLSNSLQLDAEDVLRKKTMQVIAEIDTE
jgi:MazG family protein